MTGFELWDTQSRNLIGDYDTEAEALAAVAEAIRAHGSSAVEGVMLVRVGPRGGLRRAAAGAQLAARALADEDHCAKADPGLATQGRRNPSGGRSIPSGQ